MAIVISQPPGRSTSSKGSRRDDLAPSPRRGQGSVRVIRHLPDGVRTASVVHPSSDQRDVGRGGKMRSVSAGAWRGLLTTRVSHEAAPVGASPRGQAKAAVSLLGAWWGCGRPAEVIDRDMPSPWRRRRPRGPLRPPRGESYEDHAYSPQARSGRGHHRGGVPVTQLTSDIDLILVVCTPEETIRI